MRKKLDGHWRVKTLGTISTSNDPTAIILEMLNRTNIPPAPGHVNFSLDQSAEFNQFHDRLLRM